MWPVADPGFQPRPVEVLARLRAANRTGLSRGVRRGVGAEVSTGRSSQAGPPAEREGERDVVSPAESLRKRPMGF